MEIQKTKRKKRVIRTDIKKNERVFREKLSQKVSGTLLGIWLLVAEHLRLGSWDLVKAWTGADCDKALMPRLAMQVIHECALCVNGVRASRNLCHQGFDLAAGLPFLASDQQVFDLLKDKTIQDSQELQINLGKIRYAAGHFSSDLIAIDPHRIKTASQREMPKKKKRPDQPAQKMLQAFFALDAITGQPIVSTIGSSGVKASSATLELLSMLKDVYPRHGLIMADSEHFTQSILGGIKNNSAFDFIVPAPKTAKISKMVQPLAYQSHWAGFATAITPYQFNEDSENIYYLLAQRSGEVEKEYAFEAFIASMENQHLKALSQDYPERWSIEEFFNFEGAINWSRASTINLNIRYGKASLAMIAQALLYPLRNLLPKPYKNWTAQTMASEVFKGLDGDLRVKDDTILVTFYGLPDKLHVLKEHYQNLPEKLENQGINPKAPWLYDFKVDFIFR